MVTARDETLTLAARGWPIYPVHTVADGRCTCGTPNCESPGKHPLGALVPNGLHNATTDPDTIRQWWEQRPDANVGIATGEKSGLLVVDVDPRNGGAETLADLEREHGPLPRSPEDLTGGGGRHVYFKHPGGKVKSRTIAPGLDVKADGGAVVGPGSLHVSGRRYEWEASSHPDDVPLADAPAWLLALSERPERGASEHSGDGARPRLNVKGLLTELGDGNRHDSFVRITGKLHAGGWQPEDILALLGPHAARTGYAEQLETDVRDVCGRYDPPQGAGSPHIEAVGEDGFLVTLPAGGGLVYLEAAQVTHGAHRLDADLTIRVELPATSREPFSARINLLSLGQRDVFKRQLNEAFGDLAWAVTLNRAASLIRGAYFGADPSVDLFDVRERSTDGRYRIEPLAPEGQASIIFGDGSTGKTYLALAAGLAIALGTDLAGMDTAPGRVLVVDYETDAPTHRFRIGRLLAGLGLEWRRGGISYWPARGRPLADIIGAIKRKVDRDGISLVIIDSAGAACGGEPEKAEAALRHFNALATLDATKLTLAHVPKGSSEDKPFGSVFWHNAARASWNIKRIQEEGEDVIHLGLFHRKANDGRLQHPIGLRIAFDGDTGPVTIEREDVRDVPEFSGHLSLPQRIRHQLKAGPQEAQAIADALGVPANAVRARLSDGRGRWAVALPDGRKTLWALMAEERKP